MHRVLIITYYWPPSSGAGVQRWLKFAKYLPSFAWEPVILTIDPDYAAYPAIDETLEKEISRETRIYKTPAIDYFRFYRKDKSKVPSAGFATSDDSGFRAKFMRFIRGNFFIPDPRGGWNRYAFRKACEIIETEKIKHIITTSPPHSTQLIGMKLRKRYPSLKWIADLRDPWTDIYYYSQFYHTLPAKAIDRSLEKRVLRSADQIITVGKTLRDLFVSKVPGTENKTTVITNGYDEDDFRGLSPSIPDKLTITYAGTLSGAYPLKGFLEAAGEYIKNKNALSLRFVGTVSRAEKELIIEKAGLENVEFIPHVDHHAAIKYMLETTALLLIIPDHQSGKSILTGKLFEYIASGKPVICIGPPDGDAAEIISISKAGSAHGYNDIQGISEILNLLGRGERTREKTDTIQFSRKVLTAKLAGLLEK